MAAGLIPEREMTENKNFTPKIIWKLPFAGAWKLNFAFSYNQIKRKSFVGCVVRSEKAEFKGLFSGSAGPEEARSVKDAAYIAFCTALDFAAGRGAAFLEIQAEYDAVYPVPMSQTPDIDRVTKELLARCYKMILKFKKVDFRPVTPDANEAAILLAKMAMETENSLFLADNLIPEIAAILDADVSGSYVRLVHALKL